MNTNMKQYILFIFCFFLSLCGLFSQTENMDFEYGNFDFWTLDTGLRPNPINVNWNPRPAPDLSTQIQIMNPSRPPLDENGVDCMPTMVNVPSVFPMGAFSSKIGDIQGGRKAARISRTFTVTADQSYLQYSYAVVMQDPGHRQNEQPKFVVNIRDNNGDVVTCGRFEAFAGPNALSKGFVNCNNSSLQILPWTSGGADLTPLIGQQITIEFMTLDCMLGGHGGYAYVEATLEPLEIQVEGLCVMGPNDITLTAPLGFSSYLWSTGETTRSIDVSGAQYGDVFTVDLITNTGCDTSATVTLAPVASATIDPIPDQEICEGGSAIITPTGTNAGDFYFPDINVTGNVAVVSPTADTTYTVVARDENGCIGESTTVNITVIPSSEPPFPRADFEITPVISDANNPCNTIQLDNLSGYCKSDLTYLWDFGDGTTSTEQHPIHSFPLSDTVQTYYISLTVTSASDGLSDMVSLPYTTSTIIPGFFPIQDCGIVTITNFSSICGSSLENYPSFTYSWDFGDGNPTVTTDSTQPEFQYTYTDSGVYTISMTMTDSNSGLSFSTERMVNVIAGLNADFEFYPDCYDVQFIDRSNTCDPIVSYVWDFGDGSPISTEQAPMHTYATVGPHNVTLTVDDGTTTLQQSYDVLLTPDQTTPEFDFTIICNEVTFQDFTDSCNPVLFEWDFGDGSPISEEENPVHIFEYDNSYDVTLTVDDGDGQFSITKQVIIVSEFLYEHPLDLEVCADPSVPDVGMFNFIAQTDHILSNVNPNGPFYPLVSYHLSDADATGNINSLSFDFTNTTNPQTVFARAEDSQGCYQIFPFQLRVNNTPIVNAIEDIYLCYLRENTIGYDLSQLNARAFEGMDQSGVNLSCHLNETDAMTDANDVVNINLEAGVDNIVFVRAENVDAPDCFSVSTFLIRMDNENTDVDDRCMPFFSNTMTPNDDGANDVFFIQNIETFPNNYLTIYNRWGNVVFEARGYMNDWHGTYNGNPLPVGTYYYHIELNDPDQRSHSGHITILR
ncbi:PKD domain-containing protein [Flagellimonas sp.]|uniref:gliding motility-associated C-terminal domain-containing protein n=1 Tax=Flagellimonas sp. TaxID=2058762 RepID=UPI003F4A76E1